MQAQIPTPEWSIFELLAQDEWWMPADGSAVRLVDMSHSHRRHLLRFLRGRAGKLELWHTRYSLMLVLGWPPAPESVIWDLEREFEEIVRDAAGWLERTPLVVALRVLVDVATAAGEGPEWFEQEAVSGDQAR